jgi:hypothetical protein
MSHLEQEYRLFASAPTLPRPIVKTSATIRCHVPEHGLTNHVLMGDKLRCERCLDLQQQYRSDY